MVKKTKKKVVKKKASSKVSENGKLCAILAYLLVGIIWYFVDAKLKKDKFAKYHVKQAIVFFVVWIIVSVVRTILSPVILIVGPILAILYLILVVLWIIGLINSASGKKSKLPIIGSFADKLDF